MRSTTAYLLLSAMLIVGSAGACSAQDGAPSPDPAVVSDPAPAASQPAAVMDQAWATADVTDVATGETFRIADLAGRPLIIQPMAIWCTSCLGQQGVVYETLAGMQPDSVGYILIDVDPSETAEALAAYRDRNGFTGRYVIASTELARALVAEFGDQVLNPPSTPMIVVGSDGTVTLTPFGKKSADDMRTLLNAPGA